MIDSRGNEVEPGEAPLQPTSDPVYCAECHQLVKLYPRALRGSILQVLFRLAYLGMHNEEYYPPDAILTSLAMTRARDFPILRFWGFVEQPDPEDRERRGCWRITALGRMFVQGVVKVQRTALVFDNRCYGFEGDTVTFAEMAAEPLNLEEILGGLPQLEV